jgi:hypothetical protein
MGRELQQAKGSGGGLTITSTLLEDIAPVTESLRKADRDEAAHARVDPCRSVEDALSAQSEVWTVSDKDGPFCLFGSASDEGVPGWGIIWLLSTDRIVSHRRELLRLTPGWLEYLSAPYIAVHNLIHESNRVHLRWVRWAGFEIVNRSPALRGTHFLEVVHYVHPRRDGNRDVRVFDGTGATGTED